MDDENKNDERNYAGKSIWERFQIIIAGPLMNLVLPFFIMPLAFMWGSKEPLYLSDPPEILMISSESVAEKAGLRKDDLLVSVNGVETETWQEVYTNISKLDDEFIDVTVLRDRKRLNFQLNINELGQGIGWIPRIRPVIGQIQEGSAAAVAELKYGDEIISINGNKLESWSDISRIINSDSNKDSFLDFRINRGGGIISVSLKPLYYADRDLYLMGVSPAQVERSYGFVDAIELGIKDAANMFGEIFSFLRLLFQGSVGTDAVGGPVMITKIIQTAAETGLFDYLKILALLSVNLGILNLLPFPVLDGGHLLFLLIEKIKGSEISIRIRQVSQSVGMVVLLSFFVYITLMDSLRLFN